MDKKTIEKQADCVQGDDMPSAAKEQKRLLSEDHKEMFAALLGATQMVLLPCKVDNVDSAALCAVEINSAGQEVRVLPLFVPITDSMKIELPTAKQMASLSLEDVPHVSVMPSPPMPISPTEKHRPAMNFTPELARKLRKQYNDAVTNGRTEFIFEGHMLLCSYAKYLLEYLTNQGLLNE